MGYLLSRHTTLTWVERHQIRGEIRDFRQATTTSFNALRKDMTDLRGHVDTGFTEMRGKLDATATGQQQIIDLLSALIGDRSTDIEQSTGR